VFLYFYGLLCLQDNPHNSVVLFQDVRDLARTLAATLYHKAADAGAETTQAGGLPSLQQVYDQVDKLWAEAQASTTLNDEAAAALGPDMVRLVVTADGWDGRMEPAVNKAHDLLQAALQASGSPLSILQAHHRSLVKEVLLFAIEQRLNALLAGGNTHDSSGHISTRMSLAVAYRERQCQLLTVCRSRLAG
jgi:hypothetical protein